MKKFILFILVALLSYAIYAQTPTYTREGNNFTKAQQISQSQDTLTSYTYTIKEVSYPIWITKNGRCYIIRTSKKTGNEYKQYLPKEICLEICQALNIEYKENIQTNNPL